MRYLYVLGIVFVGVLALGILAYLYSVIAPYHAAIGQALYNLVIVAIYCTATLVVAGTAFIIRRLWLTSSLVGRGEVVGMHWRGEFRLLSAEHEQAKRPALLPAPHVQVTEAKDSRDIEKEIRDLAAGGRAYRDIAKDLGISFYQVQKIMSK